MIKRPLLLSGFMASGKSTLGRIVAERTGAAFFDLDAEIEAEAKKSIREIFEHSAEGTFRALERQTLERILSESRRHTKAVVVALGGGTLLQRTTRLQVLDFAVVVTLVASPTELARRAAKSSARPLLEGDNGIARIVDLLEQRQVAYAEAHACVDTERPQADVVDDLCAIWDGGGIAVAAGTSTYRVEVGTDLIRKRLSALAVDASGVLVITDSVVSRLHGARVSGSLAVVECPLQTVTLPTGEAYKNSESLQRLWQACFEHSLDRRALIVALGGGVITDMAGLAAATWMRGIRWVALPSTLLAMVDASVGGKTAIDFLNAKNCVGAFWQPCGVLCDTTLLETETASVLAKEPTVVLEMIWRCVRVKARVVSLDEREDGPRATLNLGHTLGHALEAQGSYSTHTHGEAVSMGVALALALGRHLGVTPADLEARVVRLLHRLGLPTQVSHQALSDASELLRLDKKRAGKRIRFLVAREVGNVGIHDITLDGLTQLVRGIAARLE